MRKVTFGGGNSLDNFFAGKNHEVDWLLWNDEVAAVTRDYWKTIDTVVLGRKTYEIACKRGVSTYTSPGITSYICSRTLKKSPDENTELVADAVKLLKRLKQEKGKDICILGGGDLAHSLFDANLIDEIGLNIHPILLGSGIPLFHKLKRQLKLKLQECKTLKNGCILVKYQVLNGSD